LRTGDVFVAESGPTSAAVETRSPPSMNAFLRNEFVRSHMRQLLGDNAPSAGGGRGVRLKRLAT